MTPSNLNKRETSSTVPGELVTEWKSLLGGKRKH